MNPQPPPNRVSLNTLIQFVVHESHTSLTNLAKQLSSSQHQQSSSLSSSSQDRKQLIHDYLQATQERFMRLLVLLRWVKLHKAEFDEYDEFVSSMINITSAMQYTANELFQLDQQVKNVRIPVYDLPTAINVMTTGTVNLLPSAIQQAESIFSQEQRNASGFDQSSAIQRLNDLIRMKLLQSSIPDAIQVTKIDNGQVVLSVPNQFLLILTLKYDVNYYDQLQLRQNTTTTTTTGTTTTTASHDHDTMMMTDHEDNNELSAPHDTDDNDDEKKQREKMLLLIELEKEKKNAFMWHITHLQFFVNESGVTVNPLVYHSWMRLKRVLQARLDNRMDSEPLVDLYHRLHSVAVRLVADIMSKQGHQLQYNQWKNCSIMYDIFNEHIVDDEIPFMIKYWQGAPNVNRLITDSTVSAAQWTRLAKFSLNTSHFMDDSSALVGAVESSTAATTAATTVQQQQQKKNQYAGELRFYVNSERNFVVEHRSNLSLISSSGGMKTQYSLNWAQMDLSQIVSTAMHHHIDSIMQIVYEFLRNEPNFHIPISLLTSHTPGSPSILRAQLFEKYSLDVTIDWRNGKFQLSVNKDNFSVSTTGLDGFKKMHDMINKYDESKLKQPFGSVLVQAIENIRMLVIIHAYTHASKLLGLDTFHFLPGVHREREQKSNHMLFIRAPTCPSAFISIKANTSQKMRKPVSCRIILQVSPKLVERKITDFMTQKQNGYHYQTYHQQNGHSDSSTIVDDHPNTTHHHYHKSGHLAAMKHLKMIIDQCQTSIERYLIVSELEARDGINFQII